MGKRKPRIFVGINEIGDFTLNLAKGFRKLGYRVTNLALESDSPILESGVRHDRYIHRGETLCSDFFHRLRAFCGAAPFHDIFIFVFAESFFPSGWLAFESRIARWLAYRDLSLLKAMGKKIAVVTNGCDVRHYSANEKNAKRDGFTYHFCLDCELRKDCSLSLKKKKVEMIERYADYIFAYPMYGSLFSRPFSRPVLPIDLSAFRFSCTPTGNPLVIHAPTNRSLKGTKYILEAVERLTREGHSFRFLLCENMTNRQTREKLAESEIVVDQVLGRGHGLFALEALACGNVVLNHATPGRYGFPPDQPFIVTTPDTVYDNLKMVLENPELRWEKAREGRAYVEKYHGHVDVARAFLAQIGESPN